MVAGTQMAEVAALVGDPGRASMLALLMDGRSHPAGELADAAGVSAQTASGHLSKMVDGKLVTVMAQGRSRFYQLASDEVARMLESIMVVTADPSARSRATPRIPSELREARTCYDHLAGKLGVAIAYRLSRNRAVEWAGESCQLTDSGRALLGEMGVDLVAARGTSRRPECRPCLDWSERRPHIAGVVGLALLERLLALNWIRRIDGTRAIEITARGRGELNRLFDFA